MTLYCDASSLIKLYIAEPGSDEVRSLIARADIISSASIAYVETRAALARLRREGVFKPVAFAEARRQFERDWAAIAEIDLSEAILETAGALSERHGLRALDGIHLASLQQLLERSTDDDIEFSSFDDRLSRAARKLR